MDSIVQPIHMEEEAWGITKLTHIMGDDNARGDLSLEEDRDE